MNGMRGLPAVILLNAVAVCSLAQWSIRDAGVNANLRGIHHVGGGVAWASGTEGTVLRTLDGGDTWHRCTTPPDASKLDFRGVQAFNRSTALVMSSGSGEQSRVYRTSDGCVTWKLVLANPDAPGGFFDAIRLRQGHRSGLLVGDPVKGNFAVFQTRDSGRTWTKMAVAANSGEGLFAASNSNIVESPAGLMFVSGARSYFIGPGAPQGGAIPLQQGDSAGAFSVASGHGVLVAVGGDYRKPGVSDGTCAVSTDAGVHWRVAATPPHGYRSSVAYDSDAKKWIAVGPNGTDVSEDDGHHWVALKPSPGDTEKADQNWNALSLPFVVGPKGRIGKLRSLRAAPPG
jgi:photosystem II stability/assembly factor-like uncharacterized protein